MKTSYSSESINDLKRLREFIEEKNLQAAQKIAVSLKKGINQLKFFPYLRVKVTQAPDPELFLLIMFYQKIYYYLILLQLMIQ
jgi:hypothetical protein